MKWHKIEEKQPRKGEEVLIRYREHYYLAEYSRENKEFLLRTGGVHPHDDIQWLRLEPQKEDK